MPKQILKRIHQKISHPNNTLLKLYNCFLTNFQMKLGTSYVIGYPYYLTIDPTNYCNLKCPLCPTGKKDTSAPRGRMSLDNFKKIIDELGKYLYSIDLFNWGEPLLNKQIYQMVSYAHQNNIWTNISTNFNFFSESEAEDMVLSGLNHLIISLDGASPQTYQQYQVGGDFERVIENIKLLVRKKRELESKRPLVEWQFIPMRHNEEEIPKAKEIAKELGMDTFSLLPLRVDMGKEIFEDIGERLTKDDKWLPKSEKYSRYDYEKKSRKVERKVCQFLWTTTSIGWDGQVYPCCAVYPSKYSFGNIFEMPFRKIWNSQAYRDSRQLFKRKIKKNSETVCGQCVKHGPIDYIVPDFEDSRVNF